MNSESIEDKHFLFPSSFSKGDLVNWDTSSWELSHMEIIERSQDEVCLLPKPTDIFFPEKRDNKDTHHLCNKLRGTMSVTDNRATQTRLIKEFFKKLPNDTDHSSEYNEWFSFYII